MIQYTDAFLSRAANICWGYFLACVSAAIAGWVYDKMMGPISSMPPVGGLLMFLVISVLLVAVIALAPAAILILVAEVRMFRSAFYYGGTGAVLGGLTGLFFTYDQHPDDLIYLSVAGLIVGSTGGLTYWYFTGRHAGLWRTLSP